MEVVVAMVQLGTWPNAGRGQAHDEDDEMCDMISETKAPSTPKCNSHRTPMESIKPILMAWHPLPKAMNLHNC